MDRAADSSKPELSNNINTTTPMALSSSNDLSPILLPVEIDVKKERYPFCVVWASIPCITWFLPFVGHVGITDSTGQVYDFRGDYMVGGGARMLFGNPVKYWDISRRYVPAFYEGSSSDANLLNSESESQDARVREQIAQYDQGIARAIDHFTECERYSFCCNNCHDFAAAAMNEQPLQAGRSQETVASIGLHMFIYGKYVTCNRGMMARLPSIIILAALVLLILLLVFLL